MNILRRIRILPLLIIVAGLSFSIRVGGFMASLNGMGDAFAQQEVDAEAPPLPDRSAADGKSGSSMEESASMGAATMAQNNIEGEDGAPNILDRPTEGADWRDATESEYEYSEVQQDVYKELAARRQKLNQQEKALTRQAALLEAAERELDRKLRELTSIQNEIKGMMQEQSKEEQARIQSLVKIYEGMKAKDAARIFNTLDIDVLIRVMSRMSERKSAPILAEMNAERARTVTILLAEQQRIPDMAPQ